jgi:hypothetical protein
VIDEQQKFFPNSSLESGRALLLLIRLTGGGFVVDSILVLLGVGTAIAAWLNAEILL